MRSLNLKTASATHLRRCTKLEMACAIPSHRAPCSWATAAVFSVPNGILGAALICLSGCADARLAVRDQGTGVAVVQAHAVELRADGDRTLAEADAQGSLALRLPDNDQAIVAVRAEGFVQWSKSVGWLRKQQTPLIIQLEPVWMSGFLQTGKKPSEVIVRGSCNCSHPKAQ